MGKSFPVIAGAVEHIPLLTNSSGQITVQTALSCIWKK